MAKATKNIITPVPTVENFTVTLELSKEEAKLIRDVMYVVGGEPSTTRRRYASTVLKALDNVLGYRIRPSISDLNRDLYFVSPEEQ